MLAVMCFTVLGGTARAHRTLCSNWEGIPYINIERGSLLDHAAQALQLLNSSPEPGPPAMVLARVNMQLLHARLHQAHWYGS